MGKRWAILLGGVLALAALAPAASAQEQAQEQEIGMLFAQTATRGTMKPIPGPTPRFNLKLRGVNPQVVWFQDRPGRQSGQIPVPEFTRSWAGFGFVDDPPNAALTLLQAGDRQDTVVMELGRPHYRKKKNRVRYSAQLLDEATGNLSHLNSDLDPRVNRRFRSPSLFIDNASSKVVSQDPCIGTCPTVAVDACRIEPFTKCPSADLSDVRIVGARLHGSTLDYANLNRTTVVNGDLSEASIKRAHVQSANWNHTNLRRADLQDTELNNTDLTFANLNGAYLGGTDLSNANLSDAGVGLASGGAAGEAVRAEVIAANLTKATLVRTFFVKSDLGGSNFTNANLTNADLRFADLSEANLTGATLTGARLGGAKVCHTTWTDGKVRAPDCEPGQDEPVVLP